MSGILRPLRHRRFWLGLWGGAVIVVIALCLLPPPPLALPHNSDKLEHFLAYFLLAASAVQLFASRRALWVVAFALLAMGVAIEWAQGALTANRVADPQDVLANSLGILGGMALAFTPLRNLLALLQPPR